MHRIIGNLLFSLFVIAAISGTLGCKNESNSKKPEEVLGKIDTGTSPVVKINNRLFSIPSPIQVAQLIKDNDILFNLDYLNARNNASRYEGSFKQALNLGVYGADLGYLNLYEQLPEAGLYFAIIKMLSNDLGITSSFDKETIARIENNNSNKDSLIHIFSNIYRDADAYLMNNERNEMAVLILTGGWIESLYYLTEIAKNAPEQNVINRIGEQKYPLENLNELLTPYYGSYSDNFDTLIEQLVELAYVFDGVLIEYTFIAPDVDAENKRTVINSKSKTVISEYQLSKISEIVHLIRNSIIE